MAIIRCPECNERISSLAPTCPHCEAPQGERTDEDRLRIRQRHWRKLIYRATNVVYAAMTMLVVGAIWWWMIEPQGWALPPPASALGLVVFGAAVYLVGRAWLLWLKLPRNRPR